MTDEPLPPGGSAASAKAMLGLLAGGVLLMGAWAAWSYSTDEGATEDEAAFPELPEPSDPVARAMVATGEGYGWTWVNPLPLAMPTWHGVDRAPDGERVLIVGHAGAALRYEEGSLHVIDSGTERTLRGVAWVSESEAVAVGDEGVIVRLGRARGIVEGAHTTLRAIVAIGAGVAVAVGDEGTILRIGERARPVRSGTDAHLFGVHRRGDALFVVGASGTILRVVGDVAETERSSVSSTLRGVGGCAAGSLYAVGDRGVILRRLTDRSWRRLRNDDGETLSAVSCDHGRVAAVGAEGRVLLLSGDRLLELPDPFDRPWHGVAGGAEGPTWIVGTGGRLATIEDDHVRTRTGGPSVPIRDLGAIGGALVAVGEWGRILRQSATGFSNSESPTDSGLAALIQLTPARLLAVGDFGALVDIRHDGARMVGAPVQASFRDGVGDPDSLLIVGAGGAVLRGSLDALRASTVPDAGDLWAVSGSPLSAIAVGDGGLVLRFLESGFARVACPTGEVLRDVARMPDGTYLAVGDGGVIVRVDGEECSLDHEGGPPLHAVGVGPEGLPIAGGDAGTVIERRETGEWSPVGVNVLGISVRAIWRSDRNVYLAGTSGAIVRHILVDGT